MTLPIQPLFGDSQVLPLRGGGAAAAASNNNGRARRKACLSACWADPPTIRRERRRAVCSWSVGYGTLIEQETPRKVADGHALPDHRGRRPQRPPGPHVARATLTPAGAANRLDELLEMPGLRSLVRGGTGGGGGGAGGGRRGSGEEETQAAPLVRRDTPCGTVVRATASLASLRKCETVLRSSSSSSSVEPLQPTNRLRVSPHGSTSRLCSRCSSLLTLASGSRYSLNTSTGGFVPVTPLLCKLCLAEVPSKDICQIEQCNCSFCAECMRAYVEFEIAEGAYDISCPDAQCPSQGVLRQPEIERLAGPNLYEKHKKYRLNREVELDKSRTWCPRAGCETVCSLCPGERRAPQPQAVRCPTCSVDFCSGCRLEWHPGTTCEEHGRRMAEEGRIEEPGIPFDSDLIKCCPMCNVPIEKDEGCAQMMCKRCKHVFCWYCLASLDDDFLLRHYDKGPCKNKLGHSRASVIWHRTQVIGIFAGFGILLLVASPLLLLAAPCIVCCKCRMCNAGASKLDNEDELPGENNS